MERTVGSAIVCTLMICAISFAQAHAQDGANNAKQDDPAIAHYREGERHYAAGRYKLAIVEFEAALELSGRIALHFNIANCHERKGDYSEAAKSLEAFLEGAPSPEPEGVRERIMRLKRRAQAIETELDEKIEKRANEIAEQKVASTKTSATTGLTNSNQGAAPSFAPAYATLGIGGAGLVASLVLAGLATRSGNNAAENCKSGICTESAADDLRNEKRFALAADIGGALSIATIGVGAFLWYRADQGRQHSRLQVGPIARRNSLGVFVGARF